jgi:putative membrane protein
VHARAAGRSVATITVIKEKPMHRIRIVPLAIASLALAGLAHAADVSKSDKDFMTKAAGGGVFEVAEGKLAQSKGSSDAAKSFGSMLQQDHAAANDELKSIAEKKGVTLPTSVPGDKQKILDKLEKSKNFDHDLGQAAVKDHQEDIKDFEKESKSGKDPDVKAFAAKTLPTLRKHLQHAQALAKK